VKTPILFNEGLIQNPSFRFEMLDAFQLLVHELARKLPRVNMDDAETLAVKVRTELENYAQTLSLGPAPPADCLDTANGHPTRTFRS
jgi:hypothetical protein